jgi:redox-sensitive bicupin YhaK (pirin superfamily)
MDSKESSLLDWVVPRAAEIGPGFTVRRVLPFKGGRGVGPFVFLDHMGPHAIPAGKASDVFSHPHIGLSTVTYLFDGEIEHRDSLASLQVIRPGDVNWMTAGRGIVHAEKTPPEAKLRDRTLHGLQAWVALPTHEEDREPSFDHHPKETLPLFTRDGVELRLIAGEAFGLKSPVATFSRLFYLHGEMKAGSAFAFDSEGQEAAIYLVGGALKLEGRDYEAPGLLLFRAGAEFSVEAVRDTRFAVLGGEALPEHRTIWWNFVSSSRVKIEEAKRRWEAQEFPKVPGETEWVPLPKPKFGV